MDLHVELVDHLQKIKKYKNLQKQDSRYVYQNELDKVVFNMIWLMEILKI